MRLRFIVARSLLAEIGAPRQAVIRAAVPGMGAHCTSRPSRGRKAAQRSIPHPPRGRWGPESLGRAFRGLSLGAIEEGPDFSPERLTCFPLGLGQLGQGGFVAEAGEVAVLLPVLHHPLYLGTVVGLAALQLFGTQGQVGAEPVEALLPQAGSFLVVELGGVLALAGGG